MSKKTVSKCDVFIVTCETKFRKKVPSEIVMGVFFDEDLAKQQAALVFREKRELFLNRIRNTSNFKPTCLEDPTGSWLVSYWPCGSWDMKEYMKVHVTPNYIRTDMAGGTVC